MQRKSSYPVANIFLNRWSPRAMSNEPITHEELMPLFEAARWAPSAHNDQPWRFIYTHKGAKLWDQLLTLMSPFNQSWAKNAVVFVVLISKENSELSSTFPLINTFDAGAAWMSFALQGSINGLVVHAIANFDHDRARTVLDLPVEFKFELIIALGKPGNKEDLSVELQAREMPNDRKPLEEIVFEDGASLKK